MLLLAGSAVAGLLLGHAATYAIAMPDPYHRDLVLERSGHAYLPFAAQLALIVLVAGIVAVVGASAGRAGARTLPALGRRLAVAQVAGFVALEVLERVMSRAPIGDVFQHRLLWIGLAVQVVVALAAGRIVRWLARTADRVAELLSPVPDRIPLAGLVPIVVVSTRPRTGAAREARRIRGPPR